jgi:predicted ATP-dependent protease
MGGPIHSKGVLILAGFLNGRYVPDHPLSLAASLVFEQSYGGVEGDSASLAELCALLSALADVPVRQSLAVTGSINQHGQVQAVGAVNEKIEGFFDVCNARSLNGQQGVLVPSANVKHLMLRREIIDACKGDMASREFGRRLRLGSIALAAMTAAPGGVLLLRHGAPIRAPAGSRKT